jgi:hypothetical protein
MTNALIETVARALFDAENEWRAMQGDMGAPVMDDRAFNVTIAEWRMKARAALAAMKQHASENYNFVLLGDGWVICRNKEPGAITDDERAEIERRASLLSSRPRAT